jgi:hypothetical protein
MWQCAAFMRTQTFVLLLLLVMSPPVGLILLSHYESMRGRGANVGPHRTASFRVSIGRAVRCGFPAVRDGLDRPQEGPSLGEVAAGIAIGSIVCYSAPEESGSAF